MQTRRLHRDVDRVLYVKWIQESPTVLVSFFFFFVGLNLFWSRAYNQRRWRGGKRLNVRGWKCRLSKQADISLADTQRSLQRPGEENQQNKSVSKVPWKIFVLKWRWSVGSPKRKGTAPPVFLCGHHADYVTWVTCAVGKHYALLSFACWVFLLMRLENNAPKFRTAN